MQGFEKPLPLYDVKMEDGSVRRLAQVRRVGTQAQLVDPADPATIIKVNINQRTEVRGLKFSLKTTQAR